MYAVSRSKKKFNSDNVLEYQVDLQDENCIEKLANQSFANAEFDTIIIEEDFKMRGSGEIFGEKQSGFSKTFAISLLATSSKITGEKFAPSVNSFMSETASLLRKSDFGV